MEVTNRITYHLRNVFRVYRLKIAISPTFHPQYFDCKPIAEEPGASTQYKRGGNGKNNGGGIFAAFFRKLGGS